ncbi:MAG TPA: hypothetical protein ENO23_11270 [Alphaproteobacteria bacterium]|nr:hypothetical protein [Alphaproteobacteria bacterium]
MDPSDRFDIETLRTLVEKSPGSPEFPALAEATRRGGDPEQARRIAEAGLLAAPGRLAGRVALGLALLDLGRDDEARQALSTILDAVLEPHRVAAAAAAPAPSRPAEAPAPVPAPPSRPGFTDLAESLGDDELEQAFAAAEPEIESMLSPNRMAEQVLLDHAPIDDAEDADALAASLDAAYDDGADDDAVEDDELAGAPSPLFRTATMAELLARQGDEAGAEAIRRELSRSVASGAGERAVDAAVVPAPVTTNRRDAPAAASSATGQGGRRTRILATLERWLQNIQRGQA